MKPHFSWKSDSCDAEVRSGTARWDFGSPGNFVEVKFSDFREAILIDNLVLQTHNSGYSAGCLRVTNAIDEALQQYK